MSDSAPTDSTWSQRECQRAAELKHMRRLATGLLFLMLMVFVGTSAISSVWPWLAFPRAFAEAAIVGACADWFAVVALFRHPLGIPIPHTAIVPSQKDRIGESIGQFISDNFLAPPEIAARLERVDAAGWVTQWIKEPANAKQAASHLQHLFPSLLELLSEDQLRNFVRSLLRDGIDSIATAPLVARLLAALVAHGYHEEAFDLAVDFASHFLDEHKESIRQRVSKSSVSWLPSWVDSKVTDAFMAELQHTLSETRAVDHPWRIKFRGFIQRQLVRLTEDPELLDNCERIKTEVLDNTVVGGYLDWLVGRVEATVQQELTVKDGMLSSGLEQVLLGFGNWLDSDAEICATVNHWTRDLVLNTVVPNRVEIGRFVAEVVARWDTSTFVDKLELQVGKDLQYIRMNGTLVGGLVGLVIYSLGRMLG